MYSYDLSLVLPEHKFRKGWKEALLLHVRALRICLPSHLAFEVIVVNDGVETQELLHAFNEITSRFPYIRFISYAKNRGKGFALRAGVASACAPFVIFTDFDFPYLHDDIVAMYEKLAGGYDVVLGKRSGEYYRALPFRRMLLSRGYAWLNEIFLDIPVADTQSGLKGFNDYGKQLFLTTTIDSYLIDTEFLSLAFHKGCSIKAVEVTLREAVTFSEMNGKVIKTELKNFFHILSQNKALKRSEPASGKKFHIRSSGEWLLSGDFLKSRKLAFVLWFGAALYAALSHVLRNDINNYLVFKHVYLHAIHNLDLYLPYPAQYRDVNLYGPFFSVLIAPFARLPDGIGAVLWVMGNAAFLYYAIGKLPVSRGGQSTILILCVNELLLASGYMECNQAVCACIILGFCCINKGRDGRAAFFILLMAFVKIYSIAALAFIVFSKRPLKLVFWLGVWSAAFFVLPMLIAHPSFVAHSYVDWKNALLIKSAKNVHLFNLQDISVMGMIRRIFNYPALNGPLVIALGGVAFSLQYLRRRYFEDTRFRLYLLCSVLLFTVIFSNGSEGPTYIIAFPAVCLWHVLQPEKRGWVNAMLVFALVITSFSYSDILTPWFREHIAHRYSIKALPCFVLWAVIIVQILGKQFLSADTGLRSRGLRADMFERPRTRLRSQYTG